MQEIKNFYQIVEIDNFVNGKLSNDPFAQDNKYIKMLN